MLSCPLRSLTGFEEEFLETGWDTIDTASLSNQLLARCLVPPGSASLEKLDEVRRLPVHVRDRYLVELRQLSFGDLVQTTVTCSACGSQSRIDFKLSELPLQFKAPPREIELQIESVGTCRLALPTAGDQEKLASLAPVAARTTLLTMLLRQLGDRQSPFDEVDIRHLPASVRERLEAAIQAALPDFELSCDTQCSYCQANINCPFTITAFFLPSYECREVTCGHKSTPWP